jgi:hypothetical protein
MKLLPVNQRGSGTRVQRPILFDADHPPSRVTLPRCFPAEFYVVCLREEMVIHISFAGEIYQRDEIARLKLFGTVH